MDGTGDGRRTPPPGAGALGEIISAVGRLADETARGSAPRRAISARSSRCSDQLETVRRTADALEDELRRLWQQTSVGVG